MTSDDNLQERVQMSYDPGWYPDAAAQCLRWWDGSQWTTTVAPLPEAPPTTPGHSPSLFSARSVHLLKPPFSAGAFDAMFADDAGNTLGTASGSQYGRGKRGIIVRDNDGATLFHVHRPGVAKSQSVVEDARENVLGTVRTVPRLWKADWEITQGTQVIATIERQRSRTLNAVVQLTNGQQVARIAVPVRGALKVGLLHSVYTLEQLVAVDPTIRLLELGALIEIDTFLRGARASARRNHF